MISLMKSPARYAQGQNILNEFDKYLQGFGDRLMVIISKSGMKRVGPILDKCFEGKDHKLFYHVFSGECSQTQIDEITSKIHENQCTAVVGIGGGKILDTAKAVSYETKLPDVIVPTVASSDSPCSSLSIIYRDNGEFDHYLFLENCPNMVLVDTAVIAAAPQKLLIAGMGDAMATWFEARACRTAKKNNQLHTPPTHTATGLAHMCWENLKKYGRQAKVDMDAGLCTEAVEIIIETNTYLSSVGFESGGLAAAHGIQKGFTFIPALREQLHGFNVAFCLLAQLMLEVMITGGMEELREVTEFSIDVGLPVCFADLGYEKVDPDEVMNAAKKACVPGSTIHNMPFEVTPEMVYKALMDADEYGRNFQK